MEPPLVLASASPTRARILQNAGLNFLVDVASIDEGAVRTICKQKRKDAQHIARSLAVMKALEVSARHNRAWVLGADQILDCEGVWFEKPSDIEAAEQTLRALRSRSHRLISVIAIARDGHTEWCYDDQAKLTMRSFSDEFLEHYLASEGSNVLSSVGAYRIEGMGVQLFSEIQGDYFTILGLPILPVLKFLRNAGILSS